MKSIYSSPLRVYLCLATMALAGILSGLNLPISLYPNSSKPVISVEIPYGDKTPSEFAQQHGQYLESKLQAISTEATEVDKTRSYYSEEGVRFEIEFHWGTSLKAALSEVANVVHSYKSQLNEEIRNQIWIYPQKSNSGFFVSSFYSPSRTLDSLYEVLEPILMPEIIKLRDVSNPELYNPTEKEIRIELNYDKMAAFHLLPKQVEAAVKSSLTAFNGGSITVGIQNLSIQVPRVLNHIEDLNKILIPTTKQQSIHLMDIAKIDYDLKTTATRSFKTSGVPSIILFVKPRPGGNIKTMSEEIIKITQSALRSLPKDIEHQVLVNPSEFIGSAVKNVFHEVALGTFLTVVILFIFVGSLKNTVTAVIEIPLSIIIAFIPMKLSGMSINLISLGGLALSAGMNVDASVVVIENIFRHFEKYTTPLNTSKKLQILAQSVNEVKFSIIASTLTSLVVFTPLAFTSELTHALLGDLAKTVIFSHGLSAIVALVLVPTIRLQLMNSSQHQTHSHFEDKISQLEKLYIQSLEKFLKNKKTQRITYIGLAFTLSILTVVLVPRLPREIIGKPNTDAVAISINTQGNTLLKQMEETSSKIEKKILEKFKNEIDYTFLDNYQPNEAWMSAHLKNKKQMKEVLKKLGQFLTNTPSIRYEINPLNPAELSIPDPPQLKAIVRGGTLLERTETARDLYELLEKNDTFPRLWTDPNVARVKNLVLRPYHNLWSHLKNQESSLEPSDLADIVRVITNGRKIGTMTVGSFKRDITLRSSNGPQVTAESIGSIPMRINEKIIPMRALSEVNIEDATPSIYRENQRELCTISGKKNDGDSISLNQLRFNKAEKIIKDFKPKGNTTVLLEDANTELNQAIRQLIFTMLLSIGLIFLVLMIQFGDLMNTLLVLISVPLGIIGALLSLFIFNSTLSLNSILGLILLNGISVANSIILVDFFNKKIQEGLPPEQAALDVAKSRLRPILITSLTTILGMFPIALGLGEGGQVLQPLGISVAGGLWCSMGFTLFIVPALQVKYHHWRKSKCGF